MNPNSTSDGPKIMHSFQRMTPIAVKRSIPVHQLISIKRIYLRTLLSSLSAKSTKTADDEWETAWSPEGPPESDLNFSATPEEAVVLSPEADMERNGFVEKRRMVTKQYRQQEDKEENKNNSEIGSEPYSCSEIFEKDNEGLEVPSSSCSEFKSKPYGNIWEISQREEDILLQEFYRRIADGKLQTTEISRVHSFMIKTGIDRDLFATSKLLASSIQDLNYAASIFNNFQNPNLFMFNTMLRGCSVGDNPRQAFAVFDKLRAQRIELDQFSFITILKACARDLAVEAGQGIHGIAVRSGYLMFTNVKNTLLHFYGVCGRSNDALKLFNDFTQLNDLVSWNVLMGAFLQTSEPARALEMFRQMFRFGFTVSEATLLSVFSGLADLGDSIGSELIHGHCIKIGFCTKMNIVTSLIETYAKTGNVDSGRRIFDGLAVKDVVIWNCMIDKYAKVGLLEQAVALMQLMKLEGMKPNSSTLAGLFAACAASGLIKLGQRLGDYVEEEGLEVDAVLGTSMVDMYAKCGFLEKAVQVFEKMETKDVKCWTAMILGYGVHGQARNAVNLFFRMEDEGFVPNEVTFLGVLSACSHGGLVMEAMGFFESMVQVYGLLPKTGHYGCMIDLLGRAGLLEEAHDLIARLPIRSDATAWRALLAACRVYGNIELGECAKRVLDKIDGQHPADYILLSNAYAIAGRCQDHSRWQERHEQNINVNNIFSCVGTKERIAKETGCSSIEIDSCGWLERSKTEDSCLR